MSQGPFDVVRHPLKMRRLTLARRRPLTRRMVRLTLAGDDLAGFCWRAPEDHVKLFFPEPGAREPALPALVAGRLVPKPFGPRPIARDYTPRAYDADAGTLDVDVYLHGDGVASRWAAEAEIGSPIGVAGPRGSYLLRDAPPHHLLVGDETALPEIAVRVERLPAGARAHAVLLVEDEGEAQPLDSSADLAVTWLHRRHLLGSTGAALARAAVDADVSLDDGFAWVAGEATEVRAVVDALVAERGLTRARLRASGHWKRGVEGHDHHTPIGGAA